LGDDSRAVDVVNMDVILGIINNLTRSSADADNRLDAFSGQSRSTNMVPFHFYM